MAVNLAQLPSTLADLETHAIHWKGFPQPYSDPCRAFSRRVIFHGSTAFLPGMTRAAC